MAQFLLYRTTREGHHCTSAKGAQLSFSPELAWRIRALTAKDRPYKKGKLCSRTMHTLEMMVKDGYIDPDLYTLFQKEGIHLGLRPLVN